MSSLTGKKEDPGSNICWDESQVESMYPDIFRVSGAPGEIALLFGRREPSDREDGEEKVQGLRRVLLSPLTAKRLAVALDQAVQSHNRNGSPAEKKNPSTAEEQLQSILQNPPFSKTDETAARVEPIFQFLEKTKVEFGYERSFKISEGTLSGKRFLLGIKISTIGTRPHEQIMALCHQLGMPEELLKEFEVCLAGANVVGFGFDEHQSRCACKTYLEFGENFRKTIEKNRRRPEPFVFHKGFKWDASDQNRKAVATYTCTPFLSLKGLLERVANVLDPDRDARAFEPARQIVLAASRKISGSDMLYMDVTEEGSPRQSFDLNLYRADLRMEEIHHILSDMCRSYAIPSEELDVVYDPVRSEMFGHLAGGIDREGKDFLTIYHGVDGYFIP
ncbi:MAG: hypothetical protein C4576_03515 [Desulfobacteraceae bacterium]|nr:MAG: hypothetical protein C4576_03515 [Desulfobacteraceae bacterium]